MKTEKYNPQSLQLNCDKPQHTQGVLKILAGGEQSISVVTTGKNGKTIFITLTHTDEDLANAQRIVKCCNNEWKIDMHDELIRCIKDLLEYGSEFRFNAEQLLKQNRNRNKIKNGN